MSYERIQVERIAGALGAMIDGVDLSGPIDDATFAEIRRAWLENLIIFFRGQTLNDDTLMAFGRRFAPLFCHPNFVPDPIHPEIVRIHRRPGDRRIVGEDWHADTTCMPEPPSGPCCSRSMFRSMAETQCSPINILPMKACQMA